MALEYAEYVPTGILDIAGLTGELSKAVQGVGQKKAEAKKELEGLYSDVSSQLQSPEMTQSQTYNDMVLNAAQQGRDKLFNLHKDLKAGKITPNQYKQIANNLKKNWGDFSTASKEFDSRYQEYIKRQQDGVSSSLELEYASRYGRIADIANSEMIWDNTGNLYHVNMQTGQAMALQAVNRPENALINKVDVVQETNKFTKVWENDKIFQDLGRGGWKSVESFLINNEEAKMSIGYGVRAITGTPKQAASVLVDFGGYQPITYTTDREYNIRREQAIQELKSIKESEGLRLNEDDIKKIDMRMIQLVPNAEGLMDIKLTESQQKKAEELVRNQFYAQLETIVEGGAKQDWYHAPVRSGGRGGYGYGYENPENNLYEDLRTAWDISKGGTREEVLESQDRLNTLAKGEYRFEWGENGLNVSKRNYNTTTGRETFTPIGTVNNLDAIQRYFYKDPKVYDEEKRAYLGRSQKPSKTTSISEIPTASRSQWKANGWTDDQINKAIKLGKIKVM